jgi:probable HAF family extracellular repeat protein
MTSRPCIWMSVAYLAAALATTTQLAAQNNPNNNNHQPSYRLIDLGTFGGPGSFIPSGPPLLRVLNNQGAVIGLADTTTPDPYSPICLSSECLIMHGFKWENGVKTELDTLAGPNSGGPLAINELGLAVGVSENGSIDPATGYPAYNAVVWSRETPVDLGTFGGTDSMTYAVNDWGQVAGWSSNAIPDSYTAGLGPCATLDCWPVTTQIRALLWQNGRKQDLGTLGTGNDAAANLINDLGMVGGVSYTNTTPSDLGIPTQDPFFWLAGRMTDLGTLGSGHYSYPNWMNIWGQMVGASAPADSWFHAFFWNGGQMQDLGLPLGGDFSNANWINDVGQIVGDASFPGDQTYHAVLWSHGRASDLGVVSGAGCSYATTINLVGQVAGDLANCTTGEDVGAFLWQNGTMYDLNTLIPPGSGFTVTEVWQINDQGEIAGNAALADGYFHAVLLVPCGQHDPGNCQNQLLDAGESLHQSPRSQNRVKSVRDPLARFHAPRFSR